VVAHWDIAIPIVVPTPEGKGAFWFSWQSKKPEADLNTFPAGFKGVSISICF